MDKKFEKLPTGIQFEFVDIDKPEKIVMDINLNIFIGDEDEFDGEPVSGVAEITFERDNRGNYIFSEVKMFCQNHDIDPYNPDDLENGLAERLSEMLSSCVLPGNEKLNIALSNFLSEYGKSNQLKFFL